jgi:FdhE protein
MLRQTAEILRRHDALDEAEFRQAQVIGRDAALLSVVADWYRRPAERHLKAPAMPYRAADGTPPTGVTDHLLTLALRPFLSRCAEVLQQRPELDRWQHPHCPLCGGEPDFSVITPAAERHLICGRCGLRWKFEPLACPYCRNRDRSRISSFATPDGQYRLYACDVCSRYLKAYDGRRAGRPVLPVVDMVATIPLDAAAMQRGYTA